MIMLDLGFLRETEACIAGNSINKQWKSMGLPLSFGIFSMRRLAALAIYCFYHAIQEKFRRSAFVSSG